jgi:methionyl-tRNA formyltransferase
MAARDIGSVNSAACREALSELRPDLVVVYGTRIIKRDTLASVAVPFINYHAGVNPKYRGQNGAYWARSNADPDHAG